MSKNTSTVSLNACWILAEKLNAPFEFLQSDSQYFRARRAYTTAAHLRPERGFP
jgi:hypothetical protein